MNNTNFIQCQFCGQTLIDDFDYDVINNGFWCNCCDGYTYISSNKKHKFTLILEDKSNKNNIKINPTIKFKKRLSPLRYPGGKSNIIDYIYSKTQDNKMHTFVEPFAGGAGIGLAFLDANLIQRLILNDLDFGIYSLFKIIKTNPFNLIKKIKSFKPCHDDYFKAQQLINNNYSNCTLFEAAWALLLVNRLAYSGICKANPLGGKNGSIETLLSRWNPKLLCKKIENINKLSNKITILNSNATDLIEEYYWHSDTTIFIDPPYFNQGKYLYHCYLNKEEHIELNVLLDSLYKGCPGADIILFYDNETFIKNLYLYPNIKKISRIYTI